MTSLISKNSDRFCKNPYFLHSLCTSDHSYYAGNLIHPRLITKAYGDDRRSLGTRGSHASKHRMSFKTIEPIDEVVKRTKSRPKSAPKYTRNKKRSLLNYNGPAVLSQEGHPMTTTNADGEGALDYH